MTDQDKPDEQSKAKSEQASEAERREVAEHTILTVNNGTYDIPLIVYRPDPDDNIIAVQADYQGVMQKYGFNNEVAIADCRRIIGEAKISISECLGKEHVFSTTSMTFQIISKAEMPLSSVRSILEQIFNQGGRSP